MDQNATDPEPDLSHLIVIRDQILNPIIITGLCLALIANCIYLAAAISAIKKNGSGVLLVTIYIAAFYITYSLLSLSNVILNALLTATASDSHPCPRLVLKWLIYSFAEASGFQLIFFGLIQIDTLLNPLRSR